MKGSWISTEGGLKSCHCVHFASARAGRIERIDCAFTLLRDTGGGLRCVRADRAAVGFAFPLSYNVERVRLQALVLEYLPTGYEDEKGLNKEDRGCEPSQGQ